VAAGALEFQGAGPSGQVTVFGKGGRTRSVLLPPRVWGALERWRASQAPADTSLPVFAGRGVKPLSTVQAWRIVRAASVRAGIGQLASPHWLRHAHASHALDHGAPVSFVQATLGHASIATTGRYLHARPADSSNRDLPL
jgi:integrase/recombinase XerD